jgi:hypothetical protein
MRNIFNLLIGLCFFISLSGQTSDVNIPSAISDDNELNLPCFFKNNLIYLSTKLSNNDSLTFYTDTGGKNFLYTSGLKKLRIKNTTENLWESSNIKTIFTVNYISLPKREEIYSIKQKGVIEDGMLGREWFANRIWRINYKRNFLSEIANIPNNEFEPISSLYFLKDDAKQVINHLPRIEIVINNDTLSLLFDTGAQVYLSDDAQEQLKGQSLTAISFISSSIFESWKALNPEWEVIKKGDKQYRADMIRVPEIKIGSKIIGPIWFVKREEQNFQVLSRLSMDKKIVGAIGGNALSLLSDIIVDYQNEKLYVNKNYR